MTLHAVDELSGVDAQAGDFSQVPDPQADAEVDPHWLQLRAGALLPALYMPPTMARIHNPAMRVIALGLIAMFLLATALGVCLTYGPPG